MKSKNYLNYLAIILLVGMIILPASVLASISTDFTNTGAPAITVGQGTLNVQLMDVIIPDGLNGGTADIVQTIGAAAYWGGDTLNAIPPLGTTTGVGYKEDGTAGFQGTEAVVADLDADSVYTSGADTTVTNHTDTPSAGDPLSNTWTNMYYADSNGNNTYDSGEAIVDSADAVLDIGALNGTGTDDVITIGTAGINLFGGTEYCFDDSASDNADYDDGEAIIKDDGDTNLDSGDTVTTAGKADVTNFVAGDNVLFDDPGAGDNEWDTGTDDIFIDLDNDDVYTSAADTLVDADGSTTSGAGATGLAAGTALTAMGDDIGNGAVAVCTDNLGAPTAVRIDLDGDCTNNGSNDGTYVLGTSAIAAGTEVTSAWAFEDTNTDSDYDDGEDIFIENVNGELTYSASADTVLYNGTNVLAAGNAGDEMNGDPEVIYLDSDHGGTYTDGEPLVDVGDGNTLANNGDLATSGHTFLDKASGNWILDWVQLSTAGGGDLSFCDGDHTISYTDGDAILREAAPNSADGSLEISDTVVTSGSCDLENTWGAQNLVHTNVGNYVNTADIIDEIFDGELTYSAGIDTNVYTVAGLVLGDALIDFGADCDSGGAGTQVCTYTGTAPIDSNDSILIDEGQAGGAPAAPNGVVDQAADQLTAMTVQNTGTAVDPTDIQTVKLWEDTNGNNIFEPLGPDINIGLMPWDLTDSWAIAGLTWPVAPGGLRLFVSVDTAAGATTSTIQMQIPILNDPGADGGYSGHPDEGVFMTSANDGPIFPPSVPIVNANVQNIDATPPSVLSITPNTGLLTDANVGLGVYTVAVQFDESLDTTPGLEPTVSFSTPPAPSLSFASGAWSTNAFANDTYTATFDFADLGETFVPPFNVVDIDITGGQDLYGNTHVGPTSSIDALIIDTQNPTIIGFAPSTGLLTDADVGAGTFNVVLQFDETMNNAVNPGVAFSNPVPAPTSLTFASGVWSTTASTDDTYTATFDFVDNNENVTLIDIDVTGGQDANGNAHIGPTTNPNILNIDTQNPTVTPGNLTADESACTGTGGTCIIGDTITFTWDNSVDGNTDEDSTQVLADLTNFGGVAAQLLYDDGTNGDAGADDIYTYDYTVVADNDTGTFSFDLTVTDLSGNPTGPVTSTDTAPVDNIPPTVTGYTLSDGLITDADVGGVFYIDIDYSEPMDGTVFPASAYTPNLLISGTFTPNPASSGWQDADTYRDAFNVFDVNETVNVTNITVSGGDDANGNTQTLYNSGAPTGLAVDTQNPTVTAGNLTADESACTGLGGECIIGDTITFTWDNTGGGDNNTDEDPTQVLADLTNFGGGAAQLLYDDGTNGDAVGGDDTYTYDYTVVGDDDDGTFSFDLTVTDLSGNSTGPVTSTDTAPVDNIAPSITAPGSFTISNDVNANGTANIGDDVTYAIGTLAAADGDSWDVDVTTLTGTASLAPGVPDTVILGTLNGAIQFTETATDDAGNTTTGNTVAVNVDNRSALTNTSVSLLNPEVNKLTTFTINFTTSNVWPADGIFEVIFPAEFDVSGLNGNTATSLTNVDGVLTAAVAGQTATITRDGSGVAVPGSTAVSFRIATGTNGPTAGATGTFTFETQDNATTLIDVDTTVASVTLTPTPPVIIISGGGSAGGSLRPPAPPPTPTEEPLTFTDTEGHWGETYIDEAKDGGYVEGYEDNTFKPDQYITRAEASKLIALWFDMNIGDDACDPADFTDVNCDTDWFGKYVSYLFDKEIVEGYNNGEFGPGNYITRAEALKMLLFAKALQDFDFSDIVNPFSDVTIDDWFYNWVMIGFKLMIVEGYPDGNFAPHNSITRAEFTKIFVETLLNN